MVFVRPLGMQAHDSSTGHPVRRHTAGAQKAHASSKVNVSPMIISSCRLDVQQGLPHLHALPSTPNMRRWPRSSFRPASTACMLSCYQSSTYTEDSRAGTRKARRDTLPHLRMSSLLAALTEMSAEPDSAIPARIKY